MTTYRTFVPGLQGKETWVAPDFNYRKFSMSLMTLDCVHCI